MITSTEHPVWTVLLLMKHEPTWAALRCKYRKRKFCTDAYRMNVFFSITKQNAMNNSRSQQEHIAKISCFIILDWSLGAVVTCDLEEISPYGNH